MPSPLMADAVAPPSSFRSDLALDALGLWTDGSSMLDDVAAAGLIDSLSAFPWHSPCLLELCWISSSPGLCSGLLDDASSVDDLIALDLRSNSHVSTWLSR